MSDVEEKAIAEEHARKASQRAYREELIEWNRDAKAKTDLAEKDDEAITKKAEDVIALEIKRFKDNARSAFLASPLADESDFEKLFPKILERHLLDETARILREAAEFKNYDTQ